MFIGSAQNTTLLPPSAVAPEHYEELWWYSGSHNNGSTTTTPGYYFLQKGGIGLNGVSVPASNLITLSASWPMTTKYAFEVALTTTSSAMIAYAALWDITAGTIVGASQVSTTSTTFTVLRSGQFTLVSGHTYGVTLWGSTTSYVSDATDASLIVYAS